MDLATFYSIVTAVFFGALGLCIGSFLNVVIYRLPNNMSLATPPSHCTTCGYQLRWYDNIPIFSYLFLKGRCRKCKSKISARYICVEIANMILWLLCLWNYGFSDWRQVLMTVSSALACSVCICIAAIDYEHQIIFDRFQIIMLVLAIAFMIADFSLAIIFNIAGAVGVFVILLIISAIVSKKAGKEALGGGDMKFAFVSALFLGWQRTILMWIIAPVSCLIFIAIKNARTKESAEERENNAEYPFGPFLTFGFIIALLFGMRIISSYFGLLGIEI